jgi:PAS domain S-box-containing protein
MPDRSYQRLAALDSAPGVSQHVEQVAEALKISEIRYRRLFEMTRDGILILDANHGTITDANPFMSELLGYTHKELVGKELWEIGLLGDKAASQDAFQHLKTDGYIRYDDLPLYNLNGELREVEFISNLYLEDGFSVIQCNIRDVTHRKRIELELAAIASKNELIADELAVVASEKERIAEELAGIAFNNERSAQTLKISEIRYRRLFETARDGILILDSNQGHITDANPYMTELLGYSYEELIGKELWQIGLLRDKEASKEAFQSLKANGYIRYEGLPLHNRNGEAREVEFVSNLYRENGHSVIQCNIRDITARKGIESQLAVAADKNERIAETLQRSLLQAPPQDKFPGFNVKTLYEAASDEARVGGDFFDAFELTQGRIAFVVGDVSGKGLLAAARTAEAKFALRAFLHGSQAPERALADLNEFICETYRRDPVNSEIYVVMALVVVDSITGEATFLAAGAEPSMVLRANGKAELVQVSGRAIGILPGATYISSTVTLSDNDTIVMATDGITEARTGYNFLGVDGMAAIAEKAGSGISLTGLGQALYSGAKDFAGGILRDDVCLLLARRERLV